MTAARNWSPRSLNIFNADMKAALNTEYETVEPLDISKFRNFRATVLVDNTGGGANGLAALRLKVYDAELVLLHTFDLLTAINTKADQTEIVQWGADIAGAKNGSGTIGTLIDFIRGGAVFAKLTLQVTEVNNGTTSIANAHLFAY